ncbi:unnamed protein product [Sphagnum troendelagicum]|uniref:C2H2-type domain-containing protein n=1 Tax=Sphagnum troendelagicum TaxID=128251 RepID=A0ABP0T8I1_9BRYO
MKLNYSMPPKRPNSFPSSSEWGWVCEESSHHHVCRQCKREFSSGRALGGHMRAHGSLAMEDGNARVTWNNSSETVVAAAAASDKEYILRMNPKRSQRFLDQDSSDLLLAATVVATGQSTHHHQPKKAALSSGMAPEEEEEEEEEEPGPSSSSTPTETQVHKDIVFALMLLRPKRVAQLSHPPSLEQQQCKQEGSRSMNMAEKFKAPNGGGMRMMYQCATCKRIFKSHQALGGHRASHKKVKGCFARTKLPCDYLTVARGDNEEMLNAVRKSKGHECSICHRIFNSGQALGGHKRCHWGGGTGTTGPNEATTTVHNLNNNNAEGIIDLNMPAPECVEEIVGTYVLPSW